jgi:hypothetical protein
MYTDLIVWGFMPMVVAAGAAVASVYCAVRAPSTFQLVAAVLVVAGTAGSEITLFSMVRGAWPTLLPHFVVAASLLLVFVQLRRLASKRGETLARKRA